MIHATQRSWPAWKAKSCHEGSIFQIHKQKNAFLKLTFEQLSLHGMIWLTHKLEELTTDIGFWVNRSNRPLQSISIADLEYSREATILMKRMSQIKMESKRTHLTKSPTCECSQSRMEQRRSFSNKCDKKRTFTNPHFNSSSRTPRRHTLRRWIPATDSSVFPHTSKNEFVIPQQKRTLQGIVNQSRRKLYVSWYC